MQFSLLTALLAASLPFLHADDKYERRAKKNLLAGRYLVADKRDIGGWSPLPPKASFSQCSLALERIVKQPQSCAMKYMSGPARNVYSPVYNWFADSEEIDVVSVAQEFALQNGVAVEVYDAFGNEIANVDDAGNILPNDSTKFVGFELARTWALNYATFVRDEDKGVASIAQNVLSVRGQMLTVVISKSTALLPIVC